MIKNIKNIVFVIILLFGLLLPVFVFSQPIIADHTSVAEFDLLSDDDIISAKNALKIAYGHTSHGSQPITGMIVLQSELGSTYNFTRIESGCNSSDFMCDRFPFGDLGELGSLNWRNYTVDMFTYHPEYQRNVVIWSWCGGVSNNTVEGINIYLNAMNQLEQDYPNVTFVYMTGHLWNEIKGTRENTNARNQQIRNYVNANNKILFDFADIESWDPDGYYHGDTDTDACQWCSQYCSAHGEIPACSTSTCNAYYCRHSHCFNCYRKGKAFWWLLVQIARKMQGGSDTTPPLRSNGSPMGTAFPAGTTQVNLSLSTNEWANCRYSTTQGTPYNSMSGSFTPDTARRNHLATVGAQNGQSYNYYVRCEDQHGNQNTNDYGLSFSVAAPDTTPPVRSNGNPRGTAFNAGTNQVQLSLNTNENAACRHSQIANTAYADMTGNFTASNGGTVHSTSVVAADGQSYNYYVRCRDTSGNANTDDYPLWFSVNAPDTTPPATITDLIAACNTADSCYLTWTAPGNDGNSGGRASLYDLRYSTAAINAGNWNQATQATGEPSPLDPGTLQNVTVSGLAPSTAYYFAIRARDNAGNWSDLSNIASDTTLDAPDSEPPQISNQNPGGVLSSYAASVRISVNTNENAVCKYSAEDGSYPSMSEEFDITGGTFHASLIEDIEGGATYTFFVKCSDYSGNYNPTPALIEFTVPAKPHIDDDVNWQTDAGENTGNISVVGGCGLAENKKDRDGVSLALLLILLPVVYTLRKKERSSR